MGLDGSKKGRRVGPVTLVPASCPHLSWLITGCSLGNEAPAQKENLNWGGEWQRVWNQWKSSSEESIFLEKKNQTSPDQAGYSNLDPWKWSIELPLGDFVPPGLGQYFGGGTNRGLACFSSGCGSQKQFSWSWSSGQRPVLKEVLCVLDNCWFCTWIANLC